MGLKYGSVMTLAENYGGEVKGRAVPWVQHYRATETEWRLSHPPPTSMNSSSLGSIIPTTLSPLLQKSGKKLIAQAWVYGKWIRDSFLSCWEFCSEFLPGSPVTRWHRGRHAASQI